MKWDDMLWYDHDDNHDDDHDDDHDDHDDDDDDDVHDFHDAETASVIKHVCAVRVEKLAFGVIGMRIFQKT